MDQVKFVEHSQIWKDVVHLSRPYHVKFFNAHVPQILLVKYLDPFIGNN